MSGPRANAKLSEVLEGDQPGGRRIDCADPNFEQTLGNIGQQLVEKLDEGCVPEAFAAWCSVFMEEFEVLKGRDGGEWTLLGELNFGVFEATLRGMKRKKSVGAGGFSVELLLEAGAKVQRMFYDVMMADLKAGCIADDCGGACCMRI